VPTVFESSGSKTQTSEVSGEKKSFVKNLYNSPKVGMGPLTCFAVNPKGVRFETQEEKEEVILFLRQHFIVNVPWILTALVLIFSPTIVFPLFSKMIGLSTDIPMGFVLI
jgi:hypothetical protein